MSFETGTNFIDYVRIFCKSGDGGNGSMHLHRAKYVPKGGPDGGDGGRGGHIILRGNRQMWTLIHLKYKKHIRAEDGGAGSGQLKHGKQGQDIVLQVPLGTVAKDGETGEVLFEILEDGQEKILCRGGRGGLGNNYFKSATNQTPRFAQPGEPGVDADYAFTTLEPQLGIVNYYDDRSFVMADIPGIIEGAHEGKGLGLRFLRHIERNAMLLFMIPADSQDIAGEYRILQRELKLYNPELLDKQRVVAITKCDMLDDELRKEVRRHLPRKVPSVLISSLTGEGITELKDLLWNTLNAEI